MAKPETKNETPAVELLEEALHLLRQAPASLACYALGTVPFVLGLLFFWADMSRSAYASSRCAAASLALALGFIWMKTWQAAFAAVLRRRLGGGQGARRGLRGWLGVATAQTIVQPWALVLFLPASLLTLPFPWFFAFFQNVTAIGLDERDGVRGAVRRAWAQAALWPAQNILMLLGISFFALLVFFNVVMGLLAVPFLLKTFVGVQSRLMQSPWAVFNSTFFAAACALTYLCVDPLIKAAYVLRCFYGESIKTGEALWTDLARLKRIGGAAALIATVLILFPNSLGARTPSSASTPARQTVSPSAEKPLEASEAKTQPAPAAPAVSSARLDRSIQETLRSPRYAWRMPRQLKASEPEESSSVLVLFVDTTLRTIGRWCESFGDWLGRVFKKMFSSSSSPARVRPAPSSGGFSEGLWALTWILLYVPAAIVAVTLGIFAWRFWMQRKSLLPPEEADDSIQAALPDLSDEKTAADQLPTDGWLLLAQQMIDRGDYRLAMRALYLASLAALAQAGLLRIRRSKSNLDYARELRRRAHAWPGLMDLFSANVAVFDRSWYGLHDVTPEGITAFKSNYERIRSLVG